MKILPHKIERKRIRTKKTKILCSCKFELMLDNHGLMTLP